jgi:DNA-directed RNA polymerase subunit RPC12/RpoP
MSLREIACPHCHHAGYVGADRLPGILRCSNCGCTRLVREGGRSIRPSDPAPVTAVDVAKWKSIRRSRRAHIPERQPPGAPFGDDAA